MIKIIDYGMGNIQAFVNAYKRLGIPAERISDPGMLDGASHAILPGVGSFDRAMELLNASGFRNSLDVLVSNTDLRILGVCVGMQMLADGSEEGGLSGLGWVPGRVRRIDRMERASALPLPHMGWNDIEARPTGRLFEGIRDPRYYFLHSYYFDCSDEAHAIATTEYGARFTCAVATRNVYGVQFHPEKSHHWGQALLHNFAMT